MLSDRMYLFVCFFEGGLTKGGVMASRFCANRFAGVATVEGSVKWNNAITRSDLYSRPDDIRSHFARDYTRILHCTAYRRLKHKTQVFFDTSNDHVCTRIEHVNHVNSISKTIAVAVGLNSELTDAISLGHDLGHAPFGHKGEDVLNDIAKKLSVSERFWHEGNSLRFVDNIEVLDSPSNELCNLNLTYAVRDGILCHWGETDEREIFPRNELVDLENVARDDRLLPYTWEGCVVRIADKIAYLGRDIEDAFNVGILDVEHRRDLQEIFNRHIAGGDCLNNTVLIHSFILNLCSNSSPDVGIKLSDDYYYLMKDVKSYCYEHIYKHEKLERYKKFVEHVICVLFDILNDIVDDWKNMEGVSKIKKNYPQLSSDFFDYIRRYSLQHADAEPAWKKIRKIYDLETEMGKEQACLDFISGMTDKYAISMFKKAISF